MVDVLGYNKYLELDNVFVQKLIEVDKCIDNNEEQKLLFKRIKELVEIGDVGFSEIDTDLYDGLFLLLVFISTIDSLIEKYKKKGISLTIMKDTLSDVSIWLSDFYKRYGYVGTKENCWFVRTFKFDLFRIGRLEYEKGKFQKDYGEMCVGDDVVEVHIPRGGKLDHSECDKSFKDAIQFFNGQGYDFKAFSCNSWMLDEQFGEIAGEGSNLQSFEKRFKKIPNEEYNDAFKKFIFQNDFENPDDAIVTSSLQKKVIEKIKEGKKFRQKYGYILVSEFLQK
jgi:hypothetical protein